MPALPSCHYLGPSGRPEVPYILWLIVTRRVLVAASKIWQSTWAVTLQRAPEAQRRDIVWSLHKHGAHVAAARPNPIAGPPPLFAHAIRLILRRPTDGKCLLCSVDLSLVDGICPLGGGVTGAEPGPLPERERRMEQVVFCETSQFVMIHSWSNGDSSVRA